MYSRVTFFFFLLYRLGYFSAVFSSTFSVLKVHSLFTNTELTKTTIIMGQPFLNNGIVLLIFNLYQIFPLVFSFFSFAESNYVFKLQKHHTSLHVKQLELYFYPLGSCLASSTRFASSTNLTNSRFFSLGPL